MIGSAVDEFSRIGRIVCGSIILFLRLLCSSKFSVKEIGTVDSHKEKEETFLDLLKLEILRNFVDHCM
ncbi:unnamed protein product [Litomosoides sigmodontis]|uniref:Uncharacterized protein n=1 Tax=Litomosoides sigmodontis TaxID=42156 RepID=A0A3P6SEZ1_LITSI|nr:unnamed protein product [Litomosoides sigmodontis]